jgi:hypothetical protein
MKMVKMGFISTHGLFYDYAYMSQGVAAK